MKYSITGRLKLTDEQTFISLLNKYELWKLDPRKARDKFTGEEVYVFEVWVNTVGHKNSLFNDLKPLVDEMGESISWHECTHDEPSHTACNIVETYMNGGE